jgi:hypothetical protein
VATTADAWSAAGNSYLGVTCHWIDRESRVRKSCVLACSLMEKKHTGDYIAQMLDNIQTQFKIQDSVVRTTTDNGANFVSSFKLFGKQTMGIQVLPEPNPEEDAIAEDLQSMSQQAVQDLFVLNVEDAFTRAVDDEAVPIQLHDALEEEDEVNLRYNLPKHARCAAHTFNLIASADVNKVKSGFNTILIGALETCGTLWNQHSTSHNLRNAVKQVRKFFNLSISQ